MQKTQSAEGKPTSIGGRGRGSIKYAIHPHAPALRPAQVAALAALERAASEAGPWGPRGIVAMVGCGHGKSLVAQIAPTVLGSVRPLLLVPASLVQQTREQIKLWAEHYHTHPDLVSGDGVASYEMVSGVKRASYLQERSPDLLVLDEAHLCSNPESSRWKRIARYVANYPECRVVAMSGTLIYRGVDQIRHILHACLRDRNPIPSDNSLDHWSAVIDLGSEPSIDDLRYMARLAIKHNEAPTQVGVRRAFGKELAGTEGIIKTAGVAASVSLTILRVNSGRELPDEQRSAIAALSELWELPDGTELVDALEVDRARRELALGYYSRWKYPPSEDFLSARKVWAGFVRKMVLYAGEDSPGTVAQKTRDGAFGVGAKRDLANWVVQKPQEPPREAVWLTGAKERLASVVRAWVAKGGGIVWYRSVPVGNVLRDKMGLPTHGTGSKAPEGRLAAASMLVHGKGWNGQAYTRGLVLEIPTSGAMWEQLLARHHRTGQTEDVEYSVWSGSVLSDELWSRALAASKFIQDTTGEPQRLLYAPKGTE